MSRTIFDHTFETTHRSFGADVDSAPVALCGEHPSPTPHCRNDLNATRSRRFHLWRWGDQAR